MDELTLQTPTNTTSYTDDNVITLEGLEHVRLRPGMYIGKLGDGSSADDGIYVLLKEVVDNSIDEFRMKCGHVIDITKYGVALSGAKVRSRGGLLQHQFHFFQIRAGPQTQAGFLAALRTGALRKKFQNLNQFQFQQRFFV